MNPARFAFTHARAVILGVLLLCAAGGIGLALLASSIYPSLHFPRVVVVAHSGTLPPRSMVLEVTRPLEQAAMEVPGIRRVRSRTFRGACEVSAQFADGTDMVVAEQQLQSHIAETRAVLPAEAEVSIERITTAAFPILSFNLTGGLPIPDLYDYGYYVMRPELARAAGVGRVVVEASDTREIEVIADPEKVRASGLTVLDVGEALRDANRLAPVGRYTRDGRQHLQLLSGQWTSAEEIPATPLTLSDGTVIHVGDVARVVPGSPDRTRLVTGNGRDAAIVSVAQQPGSSILAVKAEVDAAMKRLASALPSGLTVTKVYDLAEFVATAIANVRDAILVGGLLAVIVLALFLRNLRMTLVAAVTLPLTVLATFAFLYMFHQSIDLMSMGGIAVAIGLVIDDAVVVVENIHRKTRVEEATSELVAPVVGSTLTTVVVLVPLGLLSGVVGQFFRALSLALSVAVLISLVLALTLIPLLSRWALPKHGEGPPTAPVPRRPSRYARTLAAALDRPRLAVAAAVGLAALAAALYFVVPSGFLPQMDEGGFVVDYLTPSGTALEQTDREVRRIEAVIAAAPEVASFSRRTGSEMGFFATELNKGDILVRLKPRGQRGRSAEEVIAELRPKVQEAAPGTEIEFVQLLQDMISDLEGAAAPLEVKVFGDDPEVLGKIAERMEETARGIRGVVDLVGPQRGNPEVNWEFDRPAVARLGLTLEEVSSQLAAAGLGEVATDLRLADRSIPVRARYPDAFRFDPARFATLPVRGKEGQLVPLSALARAVPSDSQSVLLRENLRPMAMVTARIEDRDLGSTAAELRAKLQNIKLPVGYLLEVGGQYEAQRKAFRELALALGIGAALVLLLMVAQFRMFTPALVILAAAPLSFAGAFLLLLATGTELNVSSAMGLILLVGLVVKNGIVLLDYVHRLHDGGAPLREALLEAAQVRMRPILMTTLCTLFGLLPLALGLGAGAELQKPLALAVIGGLGLSTIATLYAVPSIYLAWRRD